MSKTSENEREIAKKSSDEELKNKLKKTEAKIKALDVKKSVIQDEFYRRSFFRPPKKPILIAALSIIILYAVILRVAHLFDANYYYIISPDSYLFHRMAELIISGSTAFPIVPLGTGLAYPLAYTSIVFANVFHMSTSSALVLAGEVLPLVLGVATILLMFVMANKTHNWISGVFAAFAMAIIPLAYFFQASGYIDRDGLSVLLIMLGVFVYYLQRNWHFRIGKWDLSWIIAGIAVLGIEGTLYFEWNAGPPLMIAIMTGCVIMEFIGYFLQGLLGARSRNEYSLSPMQLSYVLRDAGFVGTRLKGVPRALANRFVKAAKQTHWKLFLLVILVNALILIALPSMLSILFGMVSFATGGTSTASESQGLLQGGFSQLIGFNVLLIPMFLGFLVTFIKRREGDIFWLGWLFVTFFLSFYSVRFMIYMIPAASVLISLSLAPISRFRSLRARGRTVLVLFLIVTIFFTFSSYYIADSYDMSPSNNMMSALIWCNQNTPSNAVIMTWWDKGYWIVDIADRTPISSNGGYIFSNGYQSPQQLTDVAMAYCTNSTNTTVQIMNKYGASYLIFFNDSVAILPSLSSYAFGHSYGDGSTVPDNMKDSVYYRAVFGNFSSEDGLTKVYWAPQDQPEVVVLKLENA